MARLPLPGSDEGQWGDILNAFLSIAHDNDGMPKDVGVIADKYVLPSGGIPASDMSAAVQASLSNADNLDLSQIAGLTPSNDDVIQRKAGAWANRSMSQVKTDLVLVKGDVGLGNVDDTSDADKPISTATQTVLDTKPEWIGSGLHASRPAATAASGLWLSTDMDGGTVYYSDGATWTQISPGVLDSGGQELAYVELSALSTSTGNIWSAKDGFGAQTRAFVATVVQDVTGLSVTWIPEDTRPVEIKVAMYHMQVPTDGAVLCCRLVVDSGDGNGFINVGQQNINASAAGASMRFEFATRLPHGSQALSVGVSATAKVQLFTTSNITITGYVGSGVLGNFYPYIQVVRR